MYQEKSIYKQSNGGFKPNHGSIIVDRGFGSGGVYGAE